MGKVYYAEMSGIREEKYKRLSVEDISSTPWLPLEPKSPFYNFVPRDDSFESEYKAGWSLREIFVDSSVGVVSARDKLTIHFTERELLDTVRDFAGLPEDEARAKYGLGSDARDWKVSFAQQDLNAKPVSHEFVREILYRPFDVRVTYYTGKSRGFIGQPQHRMANQMAPRENLGLCTARSLDVKTGWEHVFCSGAMIQHHAVSLKEVNYLFPLYRYPDLAAGDLFLSDGHREPNFTSAFVKELASRLRLTFVGDGRADVPRSFGPEDVFNYIYALLHSSEYRTRFSEFLKSDFPRVPLTTDPRMFRTLAGIGAVLVQTHLLNKLWPITTRYPVAGDNAVDDVRYTIEAGATSGRVWINDTQYFDCVPPTVWDFRIGGYQVADKWLKDRKDRKLTYDELTIYQRIVSALTETIVLVDQVDEVIRAHGGWPLSGSMIRRSRATKS